jgi:hypothetical protein
MAWEIKDTFGPKVRGSIGDGISALTGCRIDGKLPGQWDWVEDAKVGQGTQIREGKRMLLGSSEKRRLYL